MVPRLRRSGRFDAAKTRSLRCRVLLAPLVAVAGLAGCAGPSGNGPGAPPAVVTDPGSGRAELPAPLLQLGDLPDLIIDPGVPPAIPLPSEGSFDLVASDGGRLASLAPDRVRPIGSIAKVMTALVVLDKLPLAGNAPGPTYTITSRDVGLLRETLAADGTFLRVEEGERFSERQLLLGLLLPSANNLAGTLGLWAAGSEDAFVAELNAKARTLGMSSTQFVDASGLSAGTVSTASDLIRLGQAALASPVLAGLVASRSAVMPDGQTVTNLDTALGSVPGWLGIKTGSTPEAGGCLLFAAERPGSGATSPRVVGAILGQRHASGSMSQQLSVALDGAASAARAAFAAYDDVDLSTLRPPQIGGAVVTRWGERSGLRAEYMSGEVLLVRKGTSVSLRPIPVEHLTVPLSAGSPVGLLQGVWRERAVVTWRLVALDGIIGPSWDRLLLP